MATDTLRTEITKKRAQDLLERIAKDQLLNNPNAILRSDDGIHAFGRYTIIKSQHGYQIFRGATLAAEPTSNKVAISWCVADKYGKHSLAQSLIFLDLEIERRVNEIAYYQHTISNTDDLQKKYVVSDRLRESTARLKYAREQLDKCLNSAKYWQQKGFKDETARFGLKNQNTPKPEGI